MAAVVLRLLGALLLLTSLALPLAQAPDRPLPSLIARWALPPSEFITVHGQLVHLRDEGPRDDPVPILLLHGTAASLHTWSGWADGLKAQRRVIRFDLPGFGLTGPFASDHYAPDDYRDDTLVQFTLDLMDHLHLSQVVLAGNSLGGELAWRLALKAPERVSRLILVDAAGLPLPEHGLGHALLPLARTEAAGWLLEQMLPQALVEANLRQLYGQPERITPARVEQSWEINLREGNRRALVLRLRQFQPGAAAHRLAELRVPTLILWGERDRLFPPAQGREMAQRIPGSQWVLLPRLGHLPHEEDPERSLEPVRAFLQSH